MSLPSVPSCAASAPTCPSASSPTPNSPSTVDTSDEWISQRTGIRQRHIAGRGRDDVDARDPRGGAARSRDAGLTPADIDLIIVATSTPDYTFPAAATQIQAALGITQRRRLRPAGGLLRLRLRGATADKFLTSGSHKRALVIGAETFSRLLDWEDRTTCVLFGDGAGAIVLEARRRRGGRPRRRASPRSCARTDATAPSSMSTAGRRRPGRSAICAWRARRCSGTRSAWSPTSIKALFRRRRRHRRRHRLVRAASGQPPHHRRLRRQARHRRATRW